MEELCIGRLNFYPVVFTYSTGRDTNLVILVHLSAQYFPIVTEYFVIPYVNPYTFLSTVMQLVQCDVHSEYEIQRCSGTRCTSMNRQPVITEMFNF